MIHGDAIVFASTVWTVRPTTSTVATVSGEAARLVLVLSPVTSSRRSVAKAGLAQAQGDPGELLVAEAGSAGGCRDLGEDRVPDRGAAGSLLEGGGVEVGDPLEPVHSPGVLCCGLAHALAELVVVGEEPKESRQRLGLAVVDRNLGSDRGGQLREPAGVADDERLANRERADRHPGGLA